MAAEYSYNGWLASPNPADFGGLEPMVVAGESFSPGVRRGDVHTVFMYVAQQLHARVEPVIAAGWHEADDWGYNFRPNRNANNLSCHGSGTAFDYNATRHPNGKRGTFSPAHAQIIRLICAEVDNVVRWGGDFTGTADEMHFEICKDAAAVARVAAKIRGSIPSNPGDRSLTYGLMNDSLVRLVQAWFAKMFPTYAGQLPATGNYLDQTVAVVKEFQARAGVTGPDADGRILGSRTWEAMRRYGWR